MAKIGRAAHGFENMEVFQLALDFLAFADPIEAPVRRRKRALNEDFKAAAVSILANIREGATELSTRDKKRFYRYALRSTGECSALLHGIERLALISPELVSEGKALLLRLRINLLRLLKARLRARAVADSDHRKPPPATHANPRPRSLSVSASNASGRI